MLTENLLAAARAARIRAYAPYSRFPVGAALLTDEGAVVTGANIENASPGMTVCAERAAVMSAVHAGYRRFKKIAIVADCSPPPAPCGACRQVLWELAGHIEIIMGNLEDERIIKSLPELLPQPFGADRWSDNPVSDALFEAEEGWRLPVSFHPVGYVANDFNDPDQIPKNYKDLLSRIVIAPEFEEGLYRIEEEERINIISYLHRAGSYTLKGKRPGRGNQVYGVFVCRAPSRPNAIAQTTVDLVERKKNILTVRGADLAHGTPVLDLKTVMPDR